jgi:hypothetical protein
MRLKPTFAGHFLDVSCAELAAFDNFDNVEVHSLGGWIDGLLCAGKPKSAKKAETRFDGIQFHALLATSGRAVTETRGEHMK